MRCRTAAARTPSLAPVMTMILGSTVVTWPVSSQWTGWRADGGEYRRGSWNHDDTTAGPWTNLPAVRQQPRPAPSRPSSTAGGGSGGPRRTGRRATDRVGGCGTRDDPGRVNRCGGVGRSQGRRSPVADLTRCGRTELSVSMTPTPIGHQSCSCGQDRASDTTKSPYLTGPVEIGRGGCGLLTGK
jgi:hypothetical protein